MAVTVCPAGTLVVVEKVKVVAAWAGSEANIPAAIIAVTRPAASTLLFVMLP